jgi:electron transfer flavoprotein alpha subunit
MAGSVWVLAEQWRGQVTEITFEVLALAREVARDLGVPLHAVLLGHQVKDLAGALGVADSVIYVDHPGLAEATPEAWSQALLPLAQEEQPRVFLVPLTNVTMGIGTLLGAAMGIPVVNFCKDARVTDGALYVRCVLYGGKMEATVAFTDRPTILGVWPGARPADAGRSPRVPNVVERPAMLPEVSRTRFHAYHTPAAGDIDISKQDVLVAVGRGIQSKDGVELAEELAGALGGAVCGSRPVIDQGWLPLTRQVGKSGATVKPRLYLAAGISGAPEHVEGMKGAQLIVAINTDAGAPIFQVAHYGIVADVSDVLPALTEGVRTRKGTPSHA